MGLNRYGGANPFEGLEGLSEEEMARIDAEGSWQEGIAEAEGNKKAFDATNPFAAYRNKYAQQLDDFMADPNSITNTPGYKFSLDQGMQALNRTSAAKGMRLSGNALLEAQEFGGGLAAQMRNAEIDRLSGLAGADQFGGGDYAVKEATAALAGINQGMATIGGAMANAPETTTSNKIQWGGSSSTSKPAPSRDSYKDMTDPANNPQLARMQAKSDAHDKRMREGNEKAIAERQRRFKEKKAKEGSQ